MYLDAIRVRYGLCVLCDWADGIPAKFIQRRDSGTSGVLCPGAQRKWSEDHECGIYGDGRTSA